MDTSGKTIKKGRLRSVILESAAQFIQQETNGTSLITVTNCKISDNLRKAEVLVSILPVSAEESALNFMKRKRNAFRQYVKSHTKLRGIPFFDFELDKGEKNRQRLDELSQI